MNDIATLKQSKTTVIYNDEVSMQNRLAIIEDGIRKRYLSRMDDMEIAVPENLVPVEEDLIDNIRLFHISEMVYQKGEQAIDKFTTVYNTISTYNASVFLLLDSDGKKTDVYLGVRNNEVNSELKRTSVTLGDTLKTAVIGHFPGVKIESINRNRIKELSDKISEQTNISSVSVVGNNKIQADKLSNEEFLQGLDKLILAMQGRQYIGLIIAENQSNETVESLRKSFEDLYTNLSPFQKTQFSKSENSGSSSGKSFSEMTGKEKAAMLGGALISVGGAIGGAIIGQQLGNPTAGMMLGGQITGQFNSFISSLAPTQQMSASVNSSTSVTTENKSVTNLLQMIDEELKRLNEFDSYGMWNVAGYFLSDDMAASEIAASNYRSLMNGENSGREVSSINSWRRKNPMEYNSLTTYLSRFLHPKFIYSHSGNEIIYVDASAAISGKELGLHMGLPRKTVPGLPVIEHAEFGKEVYKYSLFNADKEVNPKDRLLLGKVFDLGQITSKEVELNNKSLNMHTFITGSTGSGKSNTVYQILTELHQDSIPFLVVEPAKGEYKDVFGHWDDVNVYSTNPNIAELVKLNPFMFPKSIHVLEHIDGLVEIFSVCWPMYDAMPAFFKDAILKSYESVGWDLGSSTFEGKKPVYPDFEILADQLDQLIEQSDYASDIKSNYRGALITRVKSLTVGLNKYIFCSDQTPYELLFDKNCILDISRVKSSETKALIMGMIVYILNEYRIDRKTSNNSGLKHITVLEEAHNLLKNTQNGQESNLIGKSVEMLTQTIAEIRTYGEGFIIVDQSPSSVDISAIKNTNTKIVLRTPEANDREAVGRSMGLTNDQVNEIAKLPSGVAVVYQNDWVSPVLTMIDKAGVTEQPYKPVKATKIRPLKNARTDLLKALLCMWMPGPRIPDNVLIESLRVLDIDHLSKKKILDVIDEYSIFDGNIFWKSEDMEVIHDLVLKILGIKGNDLLALSNIEELLELIQDRTRKLNTNEIQQIAYFVTYTQEDN